MTPERRDLRDLEGVVGFCRSNVWTSRLIRFFTGGKWSHVFVVMDFNGTEGDYNVAEAVWSGVRVGSLAEYRKKKYTVKLVRLKDLNRDKGLFALAKLMGQRYGYLQLVGMLFMLPLRRLGLQARNPLTDGVVCSEFAATYVAYGLDDWVLVGQKDSISPARAYDYMRDKEGSEEFDL